MRRRLVVLSLTVAVGAALVAPAGATVAAKPNACKVLKASEVTRVTGFPAQKAADQQQGPPGSGICGYSLDDPSSPGRSVSVLVQKADPRELKIGYKTAKTTFAESVEPVSGFGKNAFYAGGGLNTLYVLKGGTLFYVQYIVLADTDAAAIKDDVVQMAKIVQPRT